MMFFNAFILALLQLTNGYIPTTADIERNVLLQKLDTLTQTVNQMDASIQNLQEKTHTWAIFRHHIDAWNEQMLTIEHKLELMKRTQDEQQNAYTKMFGLELTLNHILSKVIYLSDKLSNSPFPSSPSPASNVVIPMENEILTLLNNILHHAQNTNCLCRSPQVNKQTKPTKPSRDSCQSMKEPQMEQLDELHAAMKSNSQILGMVLSFVTKIDERMTEYCAELSGELSTFTDSSDLLLKHIEQLVRGVQMEVKRSMGVHKGHSSEQHAGDMQLEGNKVQGADEEEKEEEEIENQDVAKQEKEHKNYNKSSQHKEASGSSRTTVDFYSKVEFKVHNEASDKPLEYVQPNKSGCHELDGPRIDGIYKFGTVKLNEISRDFNERLCAFATPGIAWTVIQQRGPYAVQENFNQTWTAYRNGFGELYKDFWFGNEFIHQLLYYDDYVLRIELEDFAGVHKWAEYTTFRVDSEWYNYNLLIGGHTGNALDALKYHNEMDFSTYDRRNDNSLDSCCSCSSGYGSGWWFDNCFEVNLNGVYHDSPTGHNKVGIIWELWHADETLRSVRMMIRPKNYTLTYKQKQEENHNKVTEDP